MVTLVEIRVKQNEQNIANGAEIQGFRVIISYLYITPSVAPRKPCSGQSSQGARLQEGTHFPL